MLELEPPRLPRWLAEDLPFRRRRVRLSEGRRLHFIDEGVGPPVLLVHGNPTWCYLWRRVLPLLSGRRLIAPDLLGFGLSDKPRRVRDHSLRLHVDVISELVEGLGLEGLTVVGQDWGGPICASLLVTQPQRVKAAVFANTAVLPPKRPFRSKPFHRFSHWPLVSDLVFRCTLFPVPVMRKVQGDEKSIGPRELAAYAWPFRWPHHRAGPLALARMVVNAERHPSTAVCDEIGQAVLAFDGRLGLVWGTRDPVLGRGVRRHAEALSPGRVVETQAGHFLQEEVPGAVADMIEWASAR